MKSTVRVAFLSVLYLARIFISDLFDHDIRVHFLDVGQGDSILIEFPDGGLMLVDGGEGVEILSELGEILKPWERRIDILVLTHPHLDHLGGLIKIWDRFEVGELWLNPIGYITSEFLTLYTKIVSDIYNPRIRFVYRDSCVGYSGSSLCILNPKKISDIKSVADLGNFLKGENLDYPINTVKNGKDVNNSSIILLLSYGNFDILLTGDAESEVEDEIIIGLDKKYKIEVLKAGHHCSKTASSEKLLSTLRPEIAICSCGVDNRFGHPHLETLDRFEKYEIPYLRTDEEGRISIESDGNEWWIL